jgi:hypothetical protein
VRVEGTQSRGNRLVGIASKNRHALSTSSATAQTLWHQS